MVRAKLLGVVAVPVAALAVGASPAMATVTTSNITSPTDGTVLFQNRLTSPNQTFTVSGTSNGTTSDEVDIDCYQGGGFISGYTTGVAISDPGGDFSAAIPVGAFQPNTCQLIAVPHGTRPPPASDFTGPRVSFSQFGTSMIQSGINAGKTFEVDLEDTTATAQTYLANTFGAATTLVDGSSSETASAYVFFEAGGFSNSNNDNGHPTDLTRSEIQVDGQNAYGTASAYELFGGSGGATVPGFPGLTATLNSFDPSTGNAQVTDAEPIVRCPAPDAYDPTSAACASFASTGVSMGRLIKVSDGGHVTDQIDTISSTDGARHTIDLLYQTTLPGPTPGWKLPGQSSFTQHNTGDTAGSPPSSPGTIYAIDDPSSSPSFNDLIGDMTFATAYNSIRFDNALLSGNDSALIDYQRTVPAGGCTTIAWSYGTGETASEVQGYASSATSAFAPPSLSITSPPGGTVTTASSVTVSGTVSASSGVDCVSVNGVGATVSGGKWSATVPLSAGPNTLTATASSNAGGTQTSSETVTRVSPSLSALRVSPHRLSVAGRKVNGRCVKLAAKNSSAKSCRRAIKLTISYALNGPATVTITLELKAPGRKVAGRCVKQTSHNDKHAKCTRLVPIHGSIVETAVAGTNSFVFNGKIGGRTLGPGTYQVTATPTGGAPQTTTFTILA